MIKPTPYKLTCKDCGHTKIIAPQSDALLPTDRGFSVCPECNSKDIKRSTLSLLDSIKKSVFR